MILNAIPTMGPPIILHPGKRMPAGRLRLVEPPTRSVPRSMGALSPAHQIARRSVNVFAASLGLALSSPLLAVVAAAVKFTSPGPIIYSQVRIGQDRRRRAGSGLQRRAHDLGGRPFRIYKFRTMRVDAEKMSGAVWASKDDPRVTRIGTFLRKYRLDELPQLINVLKGDMNVVGPRPERPAIFQDLSRKIPDYELRQLARPGITGLAQISQSYDTDLEGVRRKVGYDLRYVSRESVFEDMRIMVKTVPVVLFGRGGW